MKQEYNGEINMVSEKRIKYFENLENTVINVNLKNNDSHLLLLEEVDEDGNIYGKMSIGGVEKGHFFSHDFIGTLNETDINYEEYKEREKRNLNYI